MTEQPGPAAPRGSLVVSGLAFDVGRHRLLEGVSFTTEPGRVLAVTGSSGSGKTTLLSLAGGLVRPAAGEATYADGPVTTRQGEPLPGTAFVLQSYGLVPTLTAEENVAVSLRSRGVAAAAATRQALTALDRVGVEDLGARLISELSGGQVQRVAVARALVATADLLLADEPTSELDEANRDIVVSELRLEADRGAVVLVATHDPAVAAQCDDELHLVDGRPGERDSQPTSLAPGHEHDVFRRPEARG